MMQAHLANNVAYHRDDAHPDLECTTEEDGAILLQVDLDNLEGQFES